jgi:hypothetical protein
MLNQRRLAARTRKLGSLDDELREWEKDSSDGQKPLRLHHSQIGRIAAVLRQLQQQLTNPNAAAGRRPPLSDRDVESAALELHRMWEFFRSKFAMRKVEWLRRYLDAVDDFAWACYRPARDAAAAAGTIQATALKEPPLLFFGGGWSPFAMPRDYPFEAERVPDEPLRTQAFVDALKKLPVPVVGIPWFQVRHLPDAVVIGHEVGHIVEDDLGLTKTMRAAIGGAAAPARRQAWESWAGEIFGDLYGQLATGPAFVGALGEVLADDPSWIAREKRTAPAWGDYPTTYVRMMLNFALLRALEKENGALKFSADADALEAEWRGVYGAKHGLTDFDADIGPIAKTLVRTSYPELGGQKLTDVLPFDTTLQDEARIAVDRLTAAATPAAGDVRALVAGARMFFAKSPNAYDTAVQDRVLDAIALSLPPGVRGTRSISQAQKTADAALGAELLGLLSAASRKEGSADL